MNAIQLPFLVEGILILTAMILGFLIRRVGKPYGGIKVGFHLFFYLWFTVGFAYVVSALTTLNTTNLTWGFVFVMGLAIVTQLVTGTWMLVSKASRKRLPKVHLVSALLLVVSDFLAFFLTGMSS